MSLATRPLESEDDVVAFIAVRNAFDPEHPMTRESLDDARTSADRLDVVAWRGGKLGYRSRLEWVQVAGPLLPAQEGR